MDRNEIISLLTDEKLFEIVKDLNNSTGCIEEDAVIRKVASEIYEIENVSLIHMIGLAPLVANELMIRYKSHISIQRSHIPCGDCGKLLLTKKIYHMNKCDMIAMGETCEERMDNYMDNYMEGYNKGFNDGVKTIKTIQKVQLNEI
jgi:hypothetical protein